MQNRNVTAVLEVIEDALAFLKRLEASGVNFIESEPELAKILKNLAVFDSGDHSCPGCSMSLKKLKKQEGKGSGRSGVVFLSSWTDMSGYLKNEPVSGKAGELLEKIIRSMNLLPDDVYIASLIRCVPEKGQIPSDSDALCCMRIIEKKIMDLKPEFIFLLGDFVVRAFLGRNVTPGFCAGDFPDWNGIKLVPSYHPSDLLTDPSKKRAFWENTKKVMAEFSAGYNR